MLIADPPAAPPESAAVGIRRWGRTQADVSVSCEAHIYKQDAVFKLKHAGVWRRPRRPKPRGEIKAFTLDSKRRLQLTVRNTADLWGSMVTLTYPGEFSADGKKVKRNLAAFLTWLRRKKVAYLWVLEFQERGAPHFHFLIRGWLPKAELARRWFEIVASGDPRHLEAGTSIEAIRDVKQAGAYVAKHARALQKWVPTREHLYGYIAKDSSKEVPDAYKNVGRFWGCSRVLEKVAFRLKDVVRDAQLSTPVYSDVKEILLPFRKAYQNKCKAWGFKWKWRGSGFILIGGASIFKTILRQAVLADAGAAPWEIWDGESGEREKFLSPEEKMKRRGQFLLDGGFSPTFPELHDPGRN